MPTAAGSDRRFRRLSVIQTVQRRAKTKKADVVEHPEVFDHVGLLFTEPPGRAGLPFI